ncbi:hypothetical protein [Bacillus glycinifermentans]|uniref:hypothetical protein n=1 Tax=Bacillus glycinifermentans TaxID=1664069 RepID=UPI001FF66D0E|nr:hypothetical protein [Bacillus glycinifermentans]UOY87859.1 hypothetical protein MW696_17620 [Bacillus glycinifermentans]
MEITPTAKSGFTGGGFIKTVTFEEAEAKKLHGVILQLKKRYREIIGMKDDRGMWAISKHFGEEQFDFCILMETAILPQALPAGMISFQVPPLTYAHTRHPQHESL